MTTVAASLPAGDSPAEALSGLFVGAAAQRSPICRDYQIARSRVRFRFAGPAMLERISGSFAHLAAADDGDEPALLVDVWDSASTATVAPAIAGTPIESDGTGPIYYYEDGGLRMLSRWRTLSAYDATAGHAWFWAPSPDEMLSWDWASPVRLILHWWLGRRGILQVHGGAVGAAGAGALIVGRGGSGKSTTSLASLLAGLVYAGDDFVAIEPRPEPYVHSLYSSGKLESHQVERFPRLAAAVANPDRLPEEKAVIYAREIEGAETSAGFPLAAILVPRITGLPETRIVPTSGAAALTALAPSTMFQLHPPLPNGFSMMADLVRRVPCHSLELGTDVDRIPGHIARFLEDR